MKEKMLMKTPIILLISIVAFFGYNLLILSQDYCNEVYSIRLLNVSLLGVSKRGENELFITLNLSNPSLKDVKIITILCDIYYEGNLIGQQYIDFSVEPLILKAQSTIDYETPIKMDEAQLYKGMQTRIRVKVTIETFIFGLVPKKTEMDYSVPY